MMEMNDREEFAEIMVGLAELYRVNLTESLLRLFYHAMKPYPLVEIKNAANRFVRSPEVGQFFPKPADLILFIEGNTENKALDAWSQVEKAVRTIGPYQSVQFDDPAIHAAIDAMGGWIALNQCDEKEWPFKAREFHKRYRGLTIKMASSIPEKLIGIVEQTNFLQGRRIPKPVRILSSHRLSQLTQTKEKS